MFYKSNYDSPIGNLTLCSDGTNLIGVWFDVQKHPEEMFENNDLKIFKDTKSWLNRYFSGGKPEISELKLAPIGNKFRQTIWTILCEIPYGKTTTYGEIAKRFGKPMSAQAVGGAIGHNPISIIIPCHRVIGKNGNLTGYAGGLDKKIKLLELEKGI